MNEAESIMRAKQANRLYRPLGTRSCGSEFSGYIHHDTPAVIGNFPGIDRRTHRTRG